MDNDGIPALSEQKMLGRYHLIERIGRGGMGDVWRAEDPVLHRRVAIKTLLTHRQSDHAYSMRFAREARAAAALNHPHILPIHDFGEHVLPDGQIITYIVMPYIAGDSLADRIRKYSTNLQRIPLQEALSYLMQAAEAIDYAHEQGVIHRDIKPGNMLLRHDNWLLLADFGIARFVDQEDITQTKTGPGFGTPEYMAPEQARGKAEAASDNYSLAVLAYQLFAGHVPFLADTGYAITIQHMTQPPPRLRQLRPDLPPAFEDALLQGLEKDPQQRPRSARAYVAAMQKALNDTPVQQGPAAPFTPAVAQDVDYATVLQETHQLTPTTPAVIHDSEESKTSQEPIRTEPMAHTKQESRLTRRQLVLGGAGLAAIGGALSIWALLAKSTGSPDGRKATPGVIATPDANAPLLTLLGHNLPARVLAWSPVENNLLLSAGSGGDGMVILWDVNTATQQKGQQTEPVRKQMFSNTANGILAAWSPDGKYVAIANAGYFSDVNPFAYSLFVYKGDLTNVAPGFAVGSILLPNIVETLSWFSSTYLITVTSVFSSNNANVLQLDLWDWLHPRPRRTPAALPGILGDNANSSLSLSRSKSLAVSPDNKYAALATTDSILIGQPKIVGNRVIWQQYGPALRFSNSPTRTKKPGGIVWAPSGLDLIAYSNDPVEPGITTWNVDGTKNDPLVFGDSKSPSDLTTIACSPASSQPYIACGNMQGTIYLWNTRHNSLVERTLQGPEAEVTALAWSADGGRLAASFADTNASILVWKI